MTHVCGYLIAIYLYIFFFFPHLQSNNNNKPLSGFLIDARKGERELRNVIIWKEFDVITI